MATRIAEKLMPTSIAVNFFIIILLGNESLNLEMNHRAVFTEVGLTHTNLPFVWRTCPFNSTGTF